MQKYQTWSASQMSEPTFRCGAKSSLNFKKGSRKIPGANFDFLLALSHLIVLSVGAGSHLFAHYSSPGASHTLLHIVSA